MKTFKNWFLKREWNDGAIEGEYWIDESGSVHFADGDVGDLNHEGIVINTAQSLIGNGDDWEEFKNELAQSIYEDQLSNTTDEDAKQDLMDKFEDDPLSFIDAESLKDRGIDLELFKVADSQIDDARIYAMRTWGWKKVIDHNVETWNFLEKDQNIMATGLGEIAFEAGISEEDMGQLEFYVYCFSNKQTYTVTIPQLEGIENPQTPTPPQQNIIPQNQTQTGNFSNFITQQQAANPTIPQPYQDEESSKTRLSNTSSDLENKAAINHGFDQDRISMPKYYKGRIGDWHIPSNS